VNPALLELALRKQRLQIKAEQQREGVMAALEVADSVLARVHRLQDGVAWMRHNAPAVSAFILVLLLMRPRFTLRWVKRALVGWQMYHHLRGRLDAALQRI
jgi:hypothetical protein